MKMFGSDGVLAHLIPQAVKQRVLRYLLQRYLGQFLVDLSLEQLSLDLDKGTGIIKNLQLNPQALNDVGEQLNLPFIFLEGYVNEISVSIPWKKLFSENSFVEISGLVLTLHPKQRSDEVSLVDSMLESMTSSIKLAQECLGEDTEETREFLSGSYDAKGGKSVGGIEHFAYAIDTVLNRIKVRFVDTTVRLEYIPSLSNSGISLEVHFKTIDYFDEAGLEKDPEKTNRNEQGQNQFHFQSFTSKKFHVEGISFYTSVFPNSSSHVPAHCTNDPQTELDPIGEDQFNSFTTNSLNSGSNKERMNAILFAKLTGRQEIRLRLKQNEEIGGPKVNFEINCGTLVCFLSPYQIHQLIELAEGIVSPEKAERTPRVGNANQKPMNHRDFLKVEHELINLTKADRTPRTLENHSWSRPPGDESEEEFYPVNDKPHERMSQSQMSDYSDLSSSYTSASSIYHNITSSNSTKRRLKKSKLDISDILTSFRIKIGGAICVILHENIISSFEDSVCLAEINKKTSDFFNGIYPLSLTGHSLKEFDEAQCKLDKVSKLSHLRMLASPIILEGSEKISANKWHLNYSFAINYLDIRECLPSSNTNHIQLFEFESYDCLHGIPLSAAKPKFNFSFKQVKPTSRTQLFKTPKLDLKISLEPCSIEADISILDRISCLLHRKKILVQAKDSLFSPDFPSSHLNDQNVFSDMIEDIGNKSAAKLNFTLDSTLFKLKLRFPIPDLRPVSDMSRAPWWKRNVRSDILTLKMEDFFFETISDPLSKGSSYEIRSRDILVLFQEKLENEPLSILRAMVQEDIERDFNPVRIVIHCYPSQQTWINFDDNYLQAEEDLMAKSMMGFLEDLSQENYSIFSSRKVASQQNNSITEELATPADKEEIDKFMNDCHQNALYQVDISCPVIQLLLPTKHICEVIYNRLVSDLLLWEPSAPNLNLLQNSAMIGQFQEVFSCNPFSLHDNFGQDEQGNFEQSNFFSIHENKSSKETKENAQNGQTLFSLQVKIDKVTGIIRAPYRDSNLKIIPGRCGEVIIKMDSAYIYAVSGYKGLADLTYVSTLAQHATVYHKSNAPASLSCLGPPISTLGMNKVLYPSNLLIGLHKGLLEDDSMKGNFSFSLKMDFDMEKNSKSVLFAGSLCGMTLKHFMTSPSECWFIQLQDMFNVEDYPIDGYKLPEVINEANFHLQNCQIEYQPLNLPLRSLICIDALSFSSNLSISSDTSILYIIMEDSGLFLSHKTSDITALEDLVCIADLGVFEFCLKVNEGNSKKNTGQSPIQECTISNNNIHIRTCADSCKALLELIIYLANDGDLVEDPLKKEDLPGHVVIDPIQSPEAICSPFVQVHTNEHEALQNMMQDAMKEASPPKQSSKTRQGDEKGCKIFIFPDENFKSKTLGNTKLPVSRSFDEKTPSFLTQTALEEALEDTTESSTCEPNSSFDEEFCILDFSPGSGIKSPATIEPQIKPYQNVKMPVEDEFYDIPDDRTSHFSTPCNFPKPVLRYLLQEVTIIWHIYGGNDFPPPTKPQKKKVRLSDRNGNHQRCTSSKSPRVVSYAKDNVNLNHQIKSKNAHQSSPKSNHAWYVNGGPGRCHSSLMEIQLSKARYLYEVYPKDAEQVCRHILLIHDIEIRDRLLTSNLNKFLYQFSSESFPRQSNSNMVQIKALISKSDPCSSEEMDLSVSVRPIRLLVDQEALLFLCNFFEHLLCCEKSEFAEEEVPQSAQFGGNPVMTINLCAAQMPTNNYPELVNIEKNRTSNDKKRRNNDNTPLMYIKSFVFSPEVPIKIDYHGNYVINSQYGALAGLLIGLGQLNNSEIALKRLINKNGILGFNKLFNFVINEWTNDIKRTQLPSILGGIGPMHSFVKLFNGVKDLIWLPIEQYHKDGRVIRGIQRGTNAFTTSSVHAVLDLSGRFVSCIQSTAETMYDMLSSGPSDRSNSLKKRPRQPQDIREGVTTAFELVRTGLGDTATAIVRAAAEEHVNKGVTGAVGGVLRQIPPTVVQPIILASEATCTVIGGVTNQLVPDARKDAADKWKHH